jgi:hypothetical protein
LNVDENRAIPPHAAHSEERTSLYRQWAVSAPTIFKVHLGVIALLVAGHLAITAGEALGHEHLLGVSRLLDLTEEGNLPTLFSALALFGCAIAAACNALTEPTPRQVWGWRTLAVGFAFLGCDEACQIHELFDQVAGDYSWTLSYAVAGLATALALLPFVARLSKGTRSRLVVGASVYVGGALGMELVEFALFHHFGDRLYRTWRFPLLLTIEEGLELLGAAFLLNALLGNLAARGGVSLRLAPLQADINEDSRRRAGAR